jgi:hypothetical protein
VVSSVDIPLSEGPVNLNWGPIMKTINEDPHAFFLQGGWSFLGGPGAGADVRFLSSLRKVEKLELHRARNLLLHRLNLNLLNQMNPWNRAAMAASMAIAMPVKTRAGATLVPEVGLITTVGALASSYEVSANVNLGDDWDELERKAAKCEFSRDFAWKLKLVVLHCDVSQRT